MTDAQIQMQMRYRRDLRIMEGWLYSPLYSNYIGMRVRRFFKGFGPSEGVIDSYLPPDLNGLSSRLSSTNITASFDCIESFHRHVSLS